MEVELKTIVTTSAQALVESMTHEEAADFCSHVAEKLDGDFTRRNNAAAEFAGGLSEQGCRFLAEVITHHFMRNKGQ